MSLLKKLGSMKPPGPGGKASEASKTDSPAPAPKALGNSASESKRKSMQPNEAGSSTKAAKYSLADFQVERTLGTGSFGRVHLVKSKSQATSKKYYALKVLKKSEIVRMKQVEHTINEKNILEKLDHPFLISMLGTFQDCANIYIIMEFVAGGELFSYLRRCGVSLSQNSNHSIRDSPIMSPGFMLRKCIWPLNTCTKRISFIGT